MSVQTPAVNHMRLNIRCSIQPKDSITPPQWHIFSSTNTSITARYSVKTPISSVETYKAVLWRDGMNNPMDKRISLRGMPQPMSSANLPM